MQKPSIIIIIILLYIMNYSSTFFLESGCTRNKKPEIALCDTYIHARKATRHTQQPRPERHTLAIGTWMLGAVPPPPLHGPTRNPSVLHCAHCALCYRAQLVPPPLPRNQSYPKTKPKHKTHMHGTCTCQAGAL